MEKGQKPAEIASGHIGGQLYVVARQIAELTLDPKNPRLHSRRQVRQIARSIQAFGFCVPVLIDRHHRVLAGYGRILACQQLGWMAAEALMNFPS